MLPMSRPASFDNLFDLDIFDFDGVNFDLDFAVAFAPVEAKAPEPAPEPASEPPAKQNPYQRMEALYKRCQTALTHSDDPQIANAAKAICARLFTTLQSQDTTYWANNPELCRKISNAFFDSGSDEVRKVFEKNIAAIFDTYAQNQLDLISGLFLTTLVKSKNDENIRKYKFLEQLVNVNWETRSKKTPKIDDALVVQTLADKLLSLVFIKRLTEDASTEKRLREAVSHILRHLSNIGTDPNTWKGLPSKDLQKLVDTSLEQANPEVTASFAAFTANALKKEEKRQISAQTSKIIFQLSQQKEICEKMANYFLLHSILLDIPLHLNVSVAEVHTHQAKNPHLVDP